MSDPRSPDRRWNWFDFALGGVALAALILLALSYLRPRPSGAPSLPELAARVEGATLPALPYHSSVASQIDTIAFGGAEPTLVLAFDPTCRVCEANHSNWVTILRQLEGRPIRVLAVAPQDSAGTSSQWLASHGMNGPTLVIPAASGAMRTNWQVHGVPATFWVDGEGRVMLARFGVLSLRDRETIIELITAVVGDSGRP